MRVLMPESALNHRRLVCFASLIDADSFVHSRNAPKECCRKPLWISCLATKASARRVDSPTFKYQSDAGFYR